MVIDGHAHIIVPEITRAARPEEDWRPNVLWKDGQQVIEFGGREIRAAIREFVEIETILQAQTAAGIDRILLCPWVSLLRYEAEPEEGLRIGQIYNEGLARLAQSYPDRVTVLGMVPLQEPELAARELESWMREPGFRGVEVAANVRGEYLGASRFTPFWEAAEAAGALVFIHPTTRGFDLPVMDEYYLWNAVGNPLETTITAAHMILAGVMEDHPRLKVMLAHGGGAIMGLRGRLRHAHSFQPQARSTLGEPTDASLKRFYYDTVVHDPEVLRSLVYFAGAERVALGSDYPFDMGTDKPTQIVRTLGLPADQEALILSGNLTRLLGLEA